MHFFFDTFIIHFVVINVYEIFPIHLEYIYTFLRIFCKTDIFPHLVKFLTIKGCQDKVMPIVFIRRDSRITSDRKSVV